MLKATVPAAAKGIAISDPAMDLGRAKAIVFTTLLALDSPEYDAESDGTFISDTLYEVFDLLCRAERGMGSDQ